MTACVPTTTPCPRCGNKTGYLLGDGRYKCSVCQRKFSQGRTLRIEREALDIIISGFLRGASANSVSREAKVNAKTVQSYFGHIRKALSDERENFLSSCYGASSIKTELFSNSEIAPKWPHSVPICCLTATANDLRLLWVDDTESACPTHVSPHIIAGWLVASDPKTAEKLQLDRIHYVGAEKFRIFWSRAKKNLASYCGGFRNNFRLYLREMEFRFNIQNIPDPQDHIRELLSHNNTSSPGEKHA